MLKNIERALAKLDQRAEGLAETAAERTLSAAQAAGERARSRAPVATGRLRSSIRAEQDGINARLLTDCPYAAAVEFGSRATPPRPFMRG